MTVAKANYRPDIDGLRAVAVLAVVGFHAFPATVHGGFVGVDVFFVISGFLISGIVLDDVQAGRFTYAGFYGRRIKRIFPALITVLFATLIAGLCLLYPSEIASLGWHTAAGAGFVSNFLLWRETGYFDAASETKPLLHLWSLGIEEQFYIVWPLLIAALSRRTVGAVIALVLVGSFAANVVWMDFYSPMTRFWELMVGAAIALARPKLHSSVAWLGAALIVGAVVGFDRDTSFPGWAASVPVIGAACIIAAPGGAVTKLLSMRPAVWIGLISYPLYLWHWPLLSLLFISEGHNLSRLARVAVVVGAFALAWATYRWIEKPIRFGEALRAPVLAGALAVIGAMGLALPLLAPDSERDRFVAYFENRPPTFHYGTAHDLFVKGREECDFLDVRTNKVRASIAPSCTARPERRAVLLWGDSHIQHLGYSLSLPGVSFMQIATSACMPGRADGSEHCRRSNAFALETIERTKPDVVVMAQRAGHLETNWSSLAADLRRRGAGAVILIGPVPQWKQDLPKFVARHHWPPPDRLSDELEVEMFRSDAALRDLANVRYVSMIQELCNEAGCLVKLGPDRDDLVAYDYGHFTPRASRYMADRVVLPAIREALIKVSVLRTRG